MRIILLLFSLSLVAWALRVVFWEPDRLRAHLDCDSPEVRPSRFDADLRIQSTADCPPMPPRLLPVVYGCEPLRFPDNPVEPNRTAVFLCGPRKGE